MKNKKVKTSMFELHLSEKNYELSLIIIKQIACMK